MWETLHDISMPRPKSGTILRARTPSGQSVSLKSLAEHLGLSQAAVSLVINRAPGAKSIPQRTQELIRKAARELNYRPNHLARSLRQQRSYTIGVVVPEISEGYAALVMSGIEDHLLQEGYFYFVVSHRHRDELIEEYPLLLQQRAVEGLIAVDTAITGAAEVPLVAVSGHREVPGVTNIVLDHARAAALAMEHLTKLGHREISFIKGQAFSSDTAIRWESVRAAAEALGVTIKDGLVGQLEGESSSPELGYHVTKKLIASGEPFSSFCVQRYLRDRRDSGIARSGPSDPAGCFRSGFRRHSKRSVSKPGAHDREAAAARDGHARRRDAVAAHCRASGSPLPQGNCGATRVDLPRQHGRSSQSNLVRATFREAQSLP